MMQFWTTTRHQGLPANAAFPCIQLSTDNWDDYTYKTLFHATLHLSPSDEITLGDVKILQQGQNRTQLPPGFDSLDESFCSLGQSASYYYLLRGFGEDFRNNYLRALRDVVYDQSILDKFQYSAGFQASLLRWDEAKAILGRRADLLTYETIRLGALAFRYDKTLSGADAPHEVDLVFGSPETLPNRMMAFIGANGTGKSHILASLAHDVTLFNPSEWASFDPSPPVFTKVLALNVKAIPEARTAYPVRRCEYYESPGYEAIIGHTDYALRLKEKIDGVVKHGRLSQLERALEPVLPPERIIPITHSLADESDAAKEEAIKLLKLSSGEAITLYLLSDILANIREGSLLVIDEPENHLHPNAIAGLMRSLDIVLSDFMSYVVIATHSPLIVQQLPARFIRVFRRCGNRTDIKPLGIESFGENLTTITNEVFQTNSTPSLYRASLERMRKTMPPETILSMFGDDLPLNARLFLNSLTDDTREGI